jgi:hypothetical protein
MAKYRVKAGRRLTYGTDANNVREAGEGEVIDLSDEDVKRYGDVVDLDTPELAKAWDERNKATQEQQQKMGAAAPQSGGIDPVFAAPAPRRMTADERQKAGLPPEPAPPAEGDKSGWLGGKKKGHE